MLQEVHAGALGGTLPGAAIGIAPVSCRPPLLRRGIVAQGPTSRSKNLPVCVSTKELPGQCSVHVTLNRNGAVNTDPASPAGSEGAALAWIHARLADSQRHAPVGSVVRTARPDGLGT